MVKSKSWLISFQIFNFIYLGNFVEGERSPAPSGVIASQPPRLRLLLCDFWHLLRRFKLPSLLRFWNQGTIKTSFSTPLLKSGTIDGVNLVPRLPTPVSSRLHAVHISRISSPTVCSRVLTFASLHLMVWSLLFCLYSEIVSYNCWIYNTVAVACRIW